MGDDPNQRGLSRKHIMHSIDACLRRLGIDYVDLYQIHRFDYETPIEETLEALDDVVRAGKARYIGASSMYAWQFAKMLYTADRHGLARFVSMQNHYNLVYREEEREMIPLCREEGIGVIPWSPLARGFLAGNRRSRTCGDTVRAKTDDYAHKMYYQDSDFDDRGSRRRPSPQRRGVPNAQVALAWLLAQPGVTAPDHRREQDAAPRRCRRRPRSESRRVRDARTHRSLPPAPHPRPLLNARLAARLRSPPGLPYHFRRCPIFGGNMKPLFRLVAVTVTISGFSLADDDKGRGNCSGLPSESDLRSLLTQAALPANGGTVGGLFAGTRMWAAVVNRDGEVCAFNTSTTDRTQVWPGSQAIAKAKAYTANAFSLDLLALSTARIYTFTQPGHSLWSLGQSNLFDPAALAAPDGRGGGKNQIAGGLIFFGGGVPLYKSGKIIGGLGVSGDTSCADHEIAKRVRNLAALNPPGGALADDIVYSPPDPASVFAHPVCLETWRNGVRIGDEQKATYPHE